MMDEIEVTVGLPRFKLEENYDMKTVLVSMGMVDAFDMQKSDFSGMMYSWNMPHRSPKHERTAAVLLNQRNFHHLHIPHKSNMLFCFALWQACLLPMTWCCPKSCTRLSWRSTRRERRLPLPPLLSWCCAAPGFQPDSSPTTPSSSSSGTTLPRASSSLADTAPPCERV